MPWPPYGEAVPFNQFPRPSLGGRSLGKLTFVPLHPPGSVRFARRRRPHHFDRPPNPLPYKPALVVAAVEHQILPARRLQFDP